MKLEQKVGWPQQLCAPSPYSPTINVSQIIIYLIGMNVNCKSTEIFCLRLVLTFYYKIQSLNFHIFCYSAVQNYWCHETLDRMVMVHTTAMASQLSMHCLFALFNGCYLYHLYTKHKNKNQIKSKNQLNLNLLHVFCQARD